MLELLLEDLFQIYAAVKSYRPLFIVALIAIPLGALIALVEVLFGAGLSLVTALRLAHPVALTAALPAGGLLIALAYKKFGADCAKGMGLVFDAADGKGSVPIRLVPLVMASSWLTHLLGGSAGREGVAVQIGAAISDQVGKRLVIPKNQFGSFRDTFIICGIAAGFAGLFQTPFAAIFFSLEVLVCGELKYKSLFPAVCSAFSSYFVAHAFGLRKFDIPIEMVSFDIRLLWKLVVLGIIFGVTGAAFAVTLVQSKWILRVKVRNPYTRIFSVGAVLALVFIACRGRYSGFGTNLTLAALGGGTVYQWDWILKLLLTALTLAAGFQGGELTPLFSIGATLGFALSGLFGLPPEFAAALGFSALFGSATNTFLAPVLIGTECFGAESLSSLVVVCAVAFFANFGKSIYGSQKRLKLFN